MTSFDVSDKLSPYFSSLSNLARVMLCDSHLPGPPGNNREQGIQYDAFQPNLRKCFCRIIRSWRVYIAHGCSHRTGYPESCQHGNDGMSTINEAGAKLFAAVSALAISATFMAMAIGPATQNIAMVA